MSIWHCEKCGLVGDCSKTGTCGICGGEATLSILPNLSSNNLSQEYINARTVSIIEALNKRVRFLEYELSKIKKILDINLS